jgi:cobalt-zinc-cadmium efflux system membrane fusion protein
MNRERFACIFLALALSASSFSCKKATPGPETGVARAEAANEKPNSKDTDLAEKSDLDRPVEELVALTCEHEKNTHECDECRYEVGFVRLPPSILEGGLVSLVRPETRKVAVPIGLTGEVRFDERRVGHVSTQVEGVVRTTFVGLGEKVRKGQPLVELESVEVGEAQAAYLEAQSLRTLARRNFERMAELRKENISSEKESLETKQALETAEIRAENALGKLTRLGTSPADARALTSGNAAGRVVLRSPMDGSVLALHAVPGESAKRDEPLATVGDNSKVWVWADLYERDIPVVTKGRSGSRLSASVSVKAYPGEEFAGSVDLVTQAMEESSRTVKVRVEVDNKAGRLLSGMFAGVSIFLPGTEEALAVPQTALLEDEGRSFAFVRYKGEYFVRRPVVVGRKWAGWVEIEEGLLPDQQVVADGSFLLKSDVLRSKMGAGCAD